MGGVTVHVVEVQPLSLSLHLISVTDREVVEMDAEQTDNLAIILAKAGLSHYYEAFKREKITLELITMMQPSDFEKVGVVHVGERVMLQSLAKAHEKEAKLGKEIKTHSRNVQTNEPDTPHVPSGSAGTSSNNESVLARAERMCKQLKKPKKPNTRRRDSYKPYKRVSTPSKEVQKGLVVIDFQGSNPTGALPLREYEKIYDGCIRFHSEMNESDVRDEIVRLVRQKKETNTHDFSCMLRTDFDFVRCINRQVRIIDGDSPFDGSGINQVYKNGAIYVRLNSGILLKSTDPVPCDSDDESPDLPAVHVRSTSTPNAVTDSSPLPPQDDGLPIASTTSVVTNAVVDPLPGPDVIDVDMCDSDDGILQTVLSISRQTAEKEAMSRQDYDKPITLCHSTLADVIRELRMCLQGGEPTEMIVRRAHVLDDAIRRTSRPSFNPAKNILVTFLGENGQDNGGLTREFFRLVAYHASAKYMEPTGCFKHNSLALQENVYFHLGQLMAMSLVLGGSAVRILSPSVYGYLRGMKPCDIIVDLDEVPDSHVRDMLKKVSCAEKTDDIRSIIGDNFELVAECGVTKPFTKITTDDKVSIVQSVALHSVILKTLGELSQFKDGLKTLGVSSLIQSQGDLLYNYFVNKKTDLTADGVRKLFTVVKFSEEGSNDRHKEENAYMMFLDYLDGCEKSK